MPTASIVLGEPTGGMRYTCASLSYGSAASATYTVPSGPTATAVGQEATGTWIMVPSVVRWNRPPSASANHWDPSVATSMSIPPRVPYSPRMWVGPDGGTTVTTPVP